MARCRELSGEMPQGLILRPTYRVHGNRPVVQLFGRLLHGPPFLVEDDRFRPYFFIRSCDAHRLAGEPDVLVQGTDLRDLGGEPVARVEVPLPAAVPRLRDRLERDGTRLLEADVRFAYRYLIDHGVRAAVEIDGPGKTRKTGLVYFRNPSLTPGRGHPSLVRLSIDLETSPDASRILSAALV